MLKDSQTKSEPKSTNQHTQISFLLKHYSKTVSQCCFCRLTELTKDSIQTLHIGTTSFTKINIYIVALIHI